MQKLQVYSANSLSDVIEQLAFFRPSGLLTIWRTADTHHEEASLLVEAGQLLRLHWGRYEGEVNEYLLHQLSLWGEIHFVFRLREVLPQLPAPAHSSYEEQPRSPAPVTQPLPTPASSFVPTLTETARGYPMMMVPRHDRTILLLIDGRRTIEDISRLTRRTISAVRASLARLKDRHLVDVPW